MTERIPHRATSDLDVLYRRRNGDPLLLEVLVSGGAERADVHQWFDAGVERSVKLVKRVPQASDLVRDDLKLVGELLLAALDVDN